MRTVIFGGATSLDNFIARADGGVDWLLWSDEANEIMAETWKTVDTIVMGRKTYEVTRQAAEAGTAPPDGAFEGIASYVFSRTLTEVPAGVNLVREDAGDFLRRFKQQPGRDIIVLGGGELGRSLLEAGVIDRVGLNIHPLLLGSGVPMFKQMTREVRLELEDSRRFKNGCMYVSYRVVH